MIIAITTSTHHHLVVRAVQMDAALQLTMFQVPHLYMYVTQDVQQLPYVQQVHTAWVVPLQWHVLNALLEPLQHLGQQHVLYAQQESIPLHILWQVLEVAHCAPLLSVMPTSS